MKDIKWHISRVVVHIFFIYAYFVYEIAYILSFLFISNFVKSDLIFFIKMESSKINLNLLGMKAQTKNELYRLLTVEAKLYLPPQKETSIYFIRGIINGGKKVRD